MLPSEQLLEALRLPWKPAPRTPAASAKRRPTRQATKQYSTTALKKGDLADWFSYLIDPNGKVYGCQFGSHEDLEAALAKKKLAPMLRGPSGHWYSSKIIDAGWAKISTMGAYSKTEMPLSPTGAQNRAIRDIIGAHIDAAKEPGAHRYHKQFVQTLS